MAGHRETPKITVDTSVRTYFQAVDIPATDVYQDSIRPTSSQQPIEGSTMLTPSGNGLEGNPFLTPTSSTAQYDGATLHSRSGSRSGSILSNAESNRLRSNSTNTYFEKSDVEYDSTEQALLPDKGNEADFEVANNVFAFSPGQLNKLLNPKSLSAFKALGGLRGLEKGLRTSITAGLSADESNLGGQITFEDATAATQKEKLSEVPLSSSNEITTQGTTQGQYSDRLRVFKDNRLPEKKAASIWKLIWLTYNDRILILLTIAAVISLALGLYETFSSGEGVEWVEGVAICVAIIIVVTVGAANDWQKERQFVKLNKRKDDREVKAIRSGKSVQISVHDVTVGDVLHLEPGDAVPADGVFITGHGVKCDESSATGESDQMKKTPGEEVWQRIQDGTATKKLDCFIISGSKVLEGVGTYLVTSVGVNSSFGKIMMSLQTENEDTPLQVKLAGLANWIGGLGSGAAILLFFVLLIKFLAALGSNPASPAAKGQEFLDILIVAITVIVVAVPEGLPLAVTLALAFATTRMLKENNLVRVLRACETMGNATTICSDKTGTLTQNKMTVVAGTIGVDQKFANSKAQEDKPSTTFANVFAQLSQQVHALLKTSIAVNSTAFEGEEKGVSTFIGSKTETALLTLAKDHLGLEGLAAERANAKVVQLIPFDSGRKCMGAVIETDNGYRLLVKGAAEIMLAKATNTITDLYADKLQVTSLGDSQMSAVANTIDEYASHSLRTIGMLYKDFPSWPPAEGKRLEEDPQMADFDSIFHGMTLVGVVGIQDPLRDGVIEAVAQCAMSGVAVRMVTGDNITTARAIATECGILRPEEDSIVMEGPKFRQLSDAEMDAVLPKLRVLARSSPEDKRILVTRLKSLGETVAVTGDGTNDGPALKAADVGFSMGIAGTEVAKEASSIILLDDNFSSTITALMWGRAVNDAVKKFLQFQITVNITAVILTFVSAVSSSDNTSVLTAVQLLWVNLIMDTLAALALATDPPTHKILQRAPQKKSDPLITINMWKMIFGQAVYQLVVTFVLYFAGMSILGYAEDRRIELNTIVFNTFVWMQIFNEFNNRRLDNKFNVFEGVHRNFWFQGINLIMIGGQILIIFVGGEAFSITRLDGSQWAISILCALPCMLWAVLIRLFPDAWFGVFFNGAQAGLMFVLRPINKALHLVFHPIAQVFRAMSRFSKRTISKVTSKKTTSEDESDNNDEEKMTSSYTSDATTSSKTTQQHNTPAVGRAFPGICTPETETHDEKSIAPHHSSTVPTFNITEPTD